MRQVRMIRISFLICAVIAVAAFWTGWLLGNTGGAADLSATEDTTDLYLDSDEDASETMSDQSGTGENETDASDMQLSETGSFDTEDPGTESDSFAASEENGTKAQKETAGNGTAEETTGIYCLRQEDETLVVYQSGSEEIFFDTGMNVSDLPEEVREDTESGIFFDSLEELYGFLENYSS